MNRLGIVLVFSLGFVSSRGSAQAVSPNIRIHPNPTTHQFETSIAIHPLNPRIVLIAANAGHSSGTVSSIGWYYTTDGGVTWSGKDTLPTHMNFTARTGDPAVGIDLDGNLFVNGTSGASTFSIIAARSTDGGVNWTQTGVPNPTNNHKNYLVVDANSNSPYANRVYVTYATINSSPINFSLSTDSGQTFSAPMTINGSVGSPNTNGPNLAVGPNGELYLTWVGMGDPGPLGLNKSTSGGISWGTPNSIRMINNVGLIKGIPFGRSLPSMAVDRSNSPRRGWVYIVYADRNPSSPDIFLIRSTDYGTTWSNPVKVNQDNSGNDQWLPWICVDPATGNLFVIYYDSRNFSANDSAEVYISASLDGGNTFKDASISDVPFKPAVLPVFPNYGGAYIGVSALRDTIWACWYDNRTGVHQVYASRILLPEIVGSVEIVSSDLPESYSLEQNYPNPFNPSTEIQFSLPQRSRVTLTIFDLLGREVATLVSEELSGGSYSTRWDAAGFSSGVYLYRLQASEFVETKKLLLLR